jgi:hypothetical protein
MCVNQVDLRRVVELPDLSDDCGEKKRSRRWKSDTAGEREVANPLSRNADPRGPNSTAVERLRSENGVCDADLSEGFQWFRNKAATHFVDIVGIKGSERENVNRFRRLSLWRIREDGQLRILAHNARLCASCLAPRSGWKVPSNAIAFVGKRGAKKILIIRMLRTASQEATGKDLSAGFAHSS